MRDTLSLQFSPHLSKVASLKEKKEGGFSSMKSKSLRVAGASCVKNQEIGKTCFLEGSAYHGVNNFFLLCTTVFMLIREKFFNVVKKLFTYAPSNTSRMIINPVR